MKKETVAQNLKKELFEENKSAYLRIDAKTADKAYKFAEGYCKFLDRSKTERETVKWSVEALEKAGFKEYCFGMPLKSGDKVYVNNRGKNIFAAVVGKVPFEKGFTIAAAHIDSPRLDLKQHPLYEESGMAFFKTHYYGGIKKYQWTAIPLALHGTVVLSDGRSVDICIGEKDSDPVFYVNDLLPHLGADQMSKKASEVITGEQLNVLVGSREFTEGNEEISEAIKLNVMKWLNENYGMKESDFLSAEIEVVPAFKARDIGFDRSLIGAYGHDDRVCAYPSLMAIMECGVPERTAFTVLADKEETGSDGNTGMQSYAMFDFIDDMIAGFGTNRAKAYSLAECLSADVNACYDPNFKEAFEAKNSSFINKGVVMTKFTGARGKSGTSDANAEFVGKVRRIFDEADVVWQTGELGKVDFGGGGTVAKFIANRNINVVDLGVAVISMHAPYEVISKTDLYMTYKAVLAFFKAK